MNLLRRSLLDLCLIFDCLCSDSTFGCCWCRVIFNRHILFGLTFGTFRKIILNAVDCNESKKRERRDCALVVSTVSTDEVACNGFRYRWRFYCANPPESGILFHYRGCAGLPDTMACRVANHGINDRTFIETFSFKIAHILTATWINASVNVIYEIRYHWSHFNRTFVGL